MFISYIHGWITIKHKDETGTHAQQNYVHDSISHGCYLDRLEALLTWIFYALLLFIDHLG